jgi:hypothetical protein
MNAALVLLAIGVLAILARMIGWSRRRAGQADLGSVSHQWVAEHRLSHPQERQQ